ncbi:DUF2007 domain-containing protein [Granulicella arctica]|uniref:DUF2007 domain-containing protein n=1 Tax=Granulicella arctica TaxID=940613 RepID=UPI0021DF9494|nr:DUF2007 domain-containing protein [Granulicella arctica]
MKFSDDFVTVGKFLAPTEAQIAKSLLEAAGIECFLQGENANNMLAMAFRARLKVRPEDEEAALELLEASDAQGDETPGSFDA